MQIHVGTLNPAKLRAVEQAACSVFPNEHITVTGVSVPSLVPDQPMSDKETIDGAINRANAVQKLHPDSDYCIGVEGGIQEVYGRYFESGWIAIIQRGSDQIGLGSSVFLPNLGKI
jgi:inosine/xanthosine triphosphatase